MRANSHQIIAIKDFNLWAKKQNSRFPYITLPPLFFIFFIYFEKIHGISTYWPSFVVVNIVRLSKTCNWQYPTKTYYYNTRKQDNKIWEKRTYFSIFIKYEGSRSNGINPEDKLMLTKLKSWEQNLEAVKISCRFYLLH